VGLSMSSTKGSSTGARVMLDALALAAGELV
jgi:hypothetical protein